MPAISADWRVIMKNKNEQIQELKKKYDCQLVTSEQYDEIAESEVVTEVEDCGSSSNYPGKFLYTVHFADGSEMEIYN
jgi:CTP:phosphocholine cytidylyltransferase-like protein